jgi:hypothetical protein
MRDCASSARRFGTCFSQPQFKYLVTGLLALMLCQETGLLRQVADGQSVSGLSRFLSPSPWSAAEVAGAWIERFHEQMVGPVKAEHERQRMWGSSNWSGLIFPVGTV